MLKKELAPDIIQYTFDPLPGKHFGNSIIALMKDSKVLLIDTAYEDQALQDLRILEETGW